MITAKLPSNLGDLITEEKDEKGNPKRNEFLQALSQAEIKSAMLVLILNEVRTYKLSINNPNSFSYDTSIGMSKISAWVDIIDLEAFIESKQGTPLEDRQYTDSRIPEE